MDQQELRAQVQASWQDPDALAVLCEDAIDLGFGSDAVVVARQLQVIDPDRVRATAALADALAASGDPREAYVVLTEALARRGMEGAWLRRRLAQLLEGFGDRENARQQLWVALTLDSDDGVAVAHWARMYGPEGSQGWTDEMVRLADRMASGIAAAWLVDAHLAVGDDPGARARIAQALAQQDEDAEAMLKLAQTLEAHARGDLVLELLAPEVDVARHGARVALVVARAHAARGQRGEARRWLDEAEAFGDPRVTPEVTALRVAL